MSLSNAAVTLHQQYHGTATSCRDHPVLPDCSTKLATGARPCTPRQRHTQSAQQSQDGKRDVQPGHLCDKACLANKSLCDAQGAFLSTATVDQEADAVSLLAAAATDLRTSCNAQGSSLPYVLFVIDGTWQEAKEIHKVRCRHALTTAGLWSSPGIAGVLQRCEICCAR